MTPPTDRRRFLRTAFALGLAGPAAPLLAVSEPYVRSGSRLVVGVAAFSFRHHFRWARGGRENPNLDESSRVLDMPGFIRYCAEIGAGSAELTSYFFPPEVDAAHFADCREAAHVNGVAIAGTAVGNNFSHPPGSEERAEQMAYVKEWIDHAVTMGAPHVRVFAGRHPRGVEPEDAVRHAIGALEEAGDYAASRGIFLGIENHDSVTTAERLLEIVTAVDNPFVGINLDSGNFIADDVYAEFAACVPYSINVQLKTEMRLEDGGREPADIPRLIGMLKDGGYAGHVVLEYEEDHDPFEAVPPLVEKLSELCG